MWRRAWIDGMDQWDHHWPETYRPVQNEGTGLLIQGTQQWVDYLASATITVHLAAAAEAAGDGPIVISDTDPQGTAADWFNQRKKAGIETPRYSALSLADLKGRVRALERAGVQILRLDLEDLRLVLESLAGQGLHRILVEGGGEVHASILDQSKQIT